MDYCTRITTEQFKGASKQKVYLDSTRKNEATSMSINSFLATVKTRGLAKQSRYMVVMGREELQQIEMGYHHNLVKVIL